MFNTRKFHVCLPSCLILEEIYKAFHVYKGCENLDMIGLQERGLERKRGLAKTLKICRSSLTPYHFLYALINDSLSTQKLSSTLVVWQNSTY